MVIRESSSCARFGHTVWLLALLGCGEAAAVPEPAPILNITLAHDSAAERATRAQLERLLAAHDVGRFFHTREVVIDEEAIPHSHPVLTLHARHLDDDGLLLSTFLHEELHWFTVARRAELDAAVAELRTRFPTLPVGYPEGANDLTSSYEHLVIDHLEHQAIRSVLGEAEAERIMAFWRNDHYRALYAIELSQEDEIAAVVARAGLLPLRPTPEARP